MITVNLYYTGTNGSAHASDKMKRIADLREKYDLHMKVERYVSDEYEEDEKYIRK